MKSRHEQVLVKVNVGVDRGIGQLVAALSLFQDLWTVESCQGPPEGAGWVCFGWGVSPQDGWRTLSEFVFGFLAPKLYQRVGDSVRLSIRAREYGDTLADLSVRSGCVPTVSRAIAELASEFSGYRLRSSEYCDDTFGTGRARC